MDYKDLFHSMIIESQGDAYAEQQKPCNPIDSVRAEAERHGVLLGITLGFRTMAEAGHLPQEIYDDWHKFVYSPEVADDPQKYRQFLLWGKTEE